MYSINANSFEVFFLSVLSNTYHETPITSLLNHNSHFYFIYYLLSFITKVFTNNDSVKGFKMAVKKARNEFRSGIERERKRDRREEGCVTALRKPFLFPSTI